MDKIWMISDTHFGNNKIIKFAGRPFSDADEMDHVLIRNWNDTVGTKDIVYILGDFADGYEYQDIADLVELLNGTKRLLLGNHDRERNWLSSKWLSLGFSEVYHQPIIIDDFWILSHEPVFLNDKMPYVNIHGHLHEKTLSLETYVNVSVEQINYTPRLLSDIKKQFVS